MSIAIHKRERVFQIIMGSLIALGLPLAFGIPEELSHKAYALAAVVVVAAALAALITAFLRRPNRPFNESPSSSQGAAAAPRLQALDQKPDPKAWSLELLKQLEWRRFEELCAAYFETLGFSSRTERFAADGGADIDLYADGSDSRSMIAQCEGWSAHTVGMRRVRELRLSMTTEQVAEGVFVTSGRFTREARDFAAKENIGLVDGSELVAKIACLEPEQSANLLKIATKGDYLSPTCPTCTVKMLPSTSTEGGRKYWRCRNYPACKQTFFFGNNAPQ